MADDKRLTSTDENPAGNIEHTGGRAVWRWAREKLDNTSILLKKLENPFLKLQDDAAKEEEESSPPGLSLSGEATDAGGGFDPYDRS